MEEGAQVSGAPPVSTLLQGGRPWAVGARSGHCWPHPCGPLRGWGGGGVADSRQLCSRYSGVSRGHPLQLPSPQLLPGFLCCFKVRPIKQPPAQSGPSVSSEPLGPGYPACVVMGSALRSLDPHSPEGNPTDMLLLSATPAGAGTQALTHCRDTLQVTTQTCIYQKERSS